MRSASTNRGLALVALVVACSGPETGTPTTPVAAAAVDRRQPAAVAQSPSPVDTAFAWSVDSAAKAARACAPTGMADDAHHDARLEPGDYLVTLVATHGFVHGKPVHRAIGRTRGRLGLRATSPLDRSPRTGESAPAPDAEVHPLYGATDVDFGPVQAPMHAEDERAPPGSWDPIYPGVLAQRWSSAGSMVYWMLLVGTLGNTRVPRLSVDGAGIHLDVLRVDATGFRGDWGAYGILRGGSGYFCAERVR